jgi:hypothetical protein
MKVFLDDERPAPPGWRRVMWPDEAIALLDSDAVTDLSLDHDLGDDGRGTGYDVLEWIEEAVATREFLPPKITVHSANPAARARMEAGITAIERLARERTARLATLASLSSVELVRRALDSRGEFKDILALLAERPADEAAAAFVVEAHAAGAAPPWWAAVLLGRLRVPSTYPQVREILVAGPGALAEAYAACAMARIAPERARHDLLELLEHGATRRVREGAAAGLAFLGDLELAPVVLAAWRRQRILRDCAAETLALLGVPAGEVHGLLRSDDPSDRALAVRIVGDALNNPALGVTDLELARAARDALAREPLDFEPSRRQCLLDRLDALLGDEASSH